MSQKRVCLGLALGALGVLMFAGTVPAMRLATGSTEQPMLSAQFVTLGRAAFAGVLSILYLLAVKAVWPDRDQWRHILIAGLGIVIGFPLFLGFGVPHVPSSHAAVITGVLPLATALAGALLLRHRASRGFWLCVLAGFALVIHYAWRSSGANGASPGLHPADGWLLLAVASAACGYVLGARLSERMPAEFVICWILVGYLPITLAGSWWYWPEQTGVFTPTVLWAFLYNAAISMWLGFFAWYRGLAIGGTMRVSQVQLVQPFITMLIAVPLLGEAIGVLELGTGLAIMAIIVLSRRARTLQARDP